MGHMDMGGHMGGVTWGRAYHGSARSYGVSEPTRLRVEAMRSRLRFMGPDGLEEAEHRSKASGCHVGRVTWDMDMRCPMCMCV